jgi:hypothetical protein
MATFLAPPLFCWDQVEPPLIGNQLEGRAPHSCYSNKLKVDLLPGTFVVIAATPENASRRSGRDSMVARIVKAVAGESLQDSSESGLIEVNIFRNIEDFGRRQEGISDSHIKHLPEIVQTTEVSVVATSQISNLAFVFKEASLQEDGADLFFTCQGMSNAFILRYRMNDTAVAEDDDHTNE